MKKETLEQINVVPNLKDFIIYTKSKLKRETKEFHSVTKTLLYYLLDSNKFINDYSKYCDEVGIENDITPNSEKIINTIKIMEYGGKDILSIFNND